MVKSICSTLVMMILITPYLGYADIESGAASYIKNKQWTTTDHSMHRLLQKDFKTGEDITKACVKCHSIAEMQFKDTIHWQWKVSKNAKYGKASSSINNFCISANKFKDKSCNDCHPSWEGKNIEGSVNCLVCHSRSTMNFNEAISNIKEFSKDFDEDSLEMVKEIQEELKFAAQNIGLPRRNNCGSCHFYGGGGDGVKHGDLDSSLEMPKRSLDVHMGIDGGNFSCTRCHTTFEHHIAGRMYTIPANGERKSLLDDDQISKIRCTSCHGEAPHKGLGKLNDHVDKVACQTCHIPKFARKLPTKMSWDWSKAGKKRKGKPYRVKDKLGKYSYLSHKGEMKWEKNVTPKYFWFNGSIKSILAGDSVDSSKTIWVSRPSGNPFDGKSLIYPFKVHKGKQPYDVINKTILAPMLSGKNGYWTLLDWEIPLKFGSDVMNLSYSGKYDFVDTLYVYPITHMVAPKESALRCSDCHQRDDGRLAGISGVYMPSRDRVDVVDKIAWWIIILSSLGVSIHGLIRVISYYRNKKK